MSRGLRFCLKLCWDCNCSIRTSLEVQISDPSQLCCRMVEFGHTVCVWKWFWDCFVVPDLGSRILNVILYLEWRLLDMMDHPGSWILDPGSSSLDPESRILDPASWIYPESRIHLYWPWCGINKWLHLQFHVPPWSGYYNFGGFINRLLLECPKTALELNIVLITWCCCGSPLHPQKRKTYFLFFRR